MKKTEQEFLNDVKTQLYEYVYRSLQNSSEELISFIQLISKNGNLNWHIKETKEKAAAIFSRLSDSILNYTLNNGDFRTYVLLNLVNITIDIYQDELFAIYLSKGYNVSPESVVGSLASAYTTAPPQNTNFPGIENTSNQYLPELGPKLVPNSLFSIPADLETQ